jgi:nitrite reductase/ring-hydroxylating ferredoxin subunit
MTWIDVSDIHDIETGKMKLVEVGSKKVVIANVEGKFYAFNDRCPHMNAALHLGTLTGKVIRCPLHFSTFDVTTGKKLTDPKEMPPELFQNIPADLVPFATRMGELLAQVEAFDLETCETKTENDRIFLKT